MPFIAIAGFGLLVWLVTEQPALRFRRRHRRVRKSDVDAYLRDSK